MAGLNRGVLSTVALEPAGYPFGSVATYAIDDAGRPIVFVSTMAEHTRNAAADPRASLIVTEAFPEGSDPLAAGRVTLIGDLLEVEGDERPAVRDRYLAANPASAYYIDFGDFSFWRLEVRERPLRGRLRPDELGRGLRLRRGRSRPSGGRWRPSGSSST